ncbi:hypothetical protein V2J09_018984 [Rumex salicifolius]
MGSSCSRVRRLPSSNNSSSSRNFPQVCENSDSSGVFYTENVASVHIEDASSDLDVQSPFTNSDAQTSVSNESTSEEMSNFSNGNEEITQSTGGQPLSNSLQSMNSSHLETLSTDTQFGHNTETVQSNSDVASRSLEEQDLGSGLQIDMVNTQSNNSLTSNIREGGTHELRSRGRRSFWDVFSRQNMTRNSDNPPIMFAIDDADELGVNGRLLLDVNSDHHNDIVAHDWGSRSNNRMGQRQSRIERLESVHRQFPGDEFGALVRISRIVILVEAINELLDEIHRQTTPFTVSTLSLPAPESIVNSLPLKNHNKLDMTDSTEEPQQCYICLAEYEEGDKIRVLPCKHEYHMPCVDKWLKEVHGICPLCRADVSASNHPQTTNS